jgi:hypothetical protein
VALSSGSGGEEDGAEDATQNTSDSDATRNTTDATAAPKTANSTAAASPGYATVEEALSEMTIQPNDLPSGFVLQEERFYTRDELFQEIPATTQAAEGGLEYALHRSFVKVNDEYPETVEVFAYVYEDAQAATTAQQYVQAEGAGAITSRLIDGQELHDYSAALAGSMEGLGEDFLFYDVNINALTSTPIHALVFAMRHANVRAEVAAVMRANPYVLPEDVARSQLLRIERGSLTSTAD